jgi:two-component system NtrC family sensor kinase
MVETLDHTQQELLHKEKLASMGQLAAGVAHELNNPLGTILLFSDVMSKELPKDSPHCKDVEMIISETLRCKRIVADLLNFSRQQVVLAKDIDIQELLDHVIDEVSYQAAFEGVSMVRNYQLDQPTIQADPVQLQQVFINLLNNAAEAIKGEGTITLTTRQLDHKRVEIEVSDTGIGIPEENLGKIFTPFFTTKLVGSGTGLGLSIIYGIIKMHRGQITVQSEVGKGTTFTVTLPIRVLEGHMTTNAPMKDVIA